MAGSMTAEIAFDQFRNDTRANVETFNTSAAGIAIASCSASLSFISSSMIIIFIIRSDRKFGSVYHRIMIGMSLFDMIQSLAMAFTTLPMPSDMLYEQFHGLVGGNTSTCDFQAFAIIFGSLGSIMFNPLLCIYYLCSIRFKMPDERFKMRLEPIMYSIAIILSLILSSAGAHFGQFNPSPKTYPWCGVSRYPWWCGSEDLACAFERGNYEASVPFTSVGNYVVLLSSIIMIVTMFFIVTHVCLKERQINARMQSQLSGRYINRVRLYKKNMLHTRDAVMSALLYTLVYLVVWHYPLIRIFRAKSDALLIEEILRLLFRPSQGTMNLFVFIYHKIRNFQNHDPMLSGYDAFKKVLASNIDPEFIVSNLTLVGRDEQLGYLTYVHNRDDDNVRRNHGHSDIEEDNGEVQNSTDRGLPSGRIESLSITEQDSSNLHNNNDGSQWDGLDDLENETTSFQPSTKSLFAISIDTGEKSRNWDNEEKEKLYYSANVGKM